MATANYIIKGKTKTIYIRFKHQEIDISSSMKMYVDPKFWDKKNQKIKSSALIPGRDKINETLALFKVHIISKFNIDFSSGIIIDKPWLDDSIKSYYNRPVIDSKYSIYFSDFIIWWLENKAKTFKSTKGEYLNEKTINAYHQVYLNVLNFEKHINKQIKLNEIDDILLDNLVEFLAEVEQYAESTIKRRIKRVKFLCDRAEQENFNINKGYKAKVFVKSREIEYKEPYLNEKEILDVFNYKSNDRALEITKDNWIIGLWTGLRVGDFLTRLDVSNINGDFIEIRTEKTKKNVAIPLHWQVKEILNKYNGGLPPKLPETKFNKRIKIIAKELGFNTKMIGGVFKFDPETGKKRKIIDTYEKWELITSHICRRSFCTNLFGKVPNHVIMDVAGWSNEAQMYAYNKQTNKESAITLLKHWERHE